MYLFQIINLTNIPKHIRSELSIVSISSRYTSTVFCWNCWPFYLLKTKLFKDLNLHSQKQPIEVFYKEGVLKSFVKFREKRPCQSFSLLKKRLWHRFIPMNFEKFLRTPFYKTSPGDCFWFSDLFYSSHCYFYSLKEKRALSNSYIAVTLSNSYISND